jgi:hypothetical protein
MIKRHNLAETMAGNRLYRVSLEAVDTVSDIDAVVAFAPGVRSAAVDGRLDASITDRILGAVTGRFALRYGLCLAEFLATADLAAGRFACPSMTEECPSSATCSCPRSLSAPRSSATARHSGSAR